MTVRAPDYDVSLARLTVRRVVAALFDGVSLSFSSPRLRGVVALSMAVNAVLFFAVVAALVSLAVWITGGLAEQEAWWIVAAAWAIRLPQIIQKNSRKWWIFTCSG